jgi:hypothetical protein
MPQPSEGYQHTSTRTSECKNVQTFVTADFQTTFFTLLRFVAFQSKALPGILERKEKKKKEKKKIILLKNYALLN